MKNISFLLLSVILVIKIVKNKIVGLFSLKITDILLIFLI